MPLPCAEADDRSFPNKNHTTLVWNPVFLTTNHLRLNFSDAGARGSLAGTAHQGPGQEGGPYRPQA
jgi:hypothetical protein